MDGDSLGVLAANKDLTLVFIAQISHYKKLTALHKLTSIVLQLTNQVSISREIMRWQGYFLKTALGTRLILSRHITVSYCCLLSLSQVMQRLKYRHNF